VPHIKGNAGLRYKLKGLTTQLRANYYGQVRFKPASLPDSQTFGAKTLFDVDLGYQFTKNLNLTVGADNVFDTYPDRNITANNISFGRFVYNRNVTQFGMNGGFYYTKLELTFF
jgi:iron complex outermembrane receptor protein